MGCAESKMDSEDNVRRCKERRRLMKEAVYARHHLAAAHSAYCRSLRLTGSALLTFASGEPLAVSQHTPAVFLRAPAAAAIPKSPPLPPSPPPMSASSPHHQQPPPSSMSTASSHQQPPPPPIRRKKAIKLPHILSESSIKSSPTPNRHFHYNPAPNSTYSTTPSLVSSVWNWDSFYPPPSPPNSEYFDRLLNTTTANPDYDSHTDTENEEKSSIHTPHPNAWNRSDKIHNHLHSLSPSESEEEETEREEVHCCELGDNDHDHYTTTSCSSDEDEAEHLKSRSDFPKNEATTKATANPGYTNADMKSKVGSNSENDYNENRGSGNSDKRIMVRHKDFTEIVAAINEYFEKAASSGDQVSGILETGRAQLDQRFKQLRKTVYHSAGVLSKLRWSWTSKPPLGVKYQFEATSFVQSGGLKSLCSTVERLLAWEKKLYQEVKAREEVKFKHEKKLSSLQSQEYRGGHNTKLDKTKVSINKLQSLIVVTSQAVSTTSSAIVGLRDSDLVPQLVELCHGLMYMWRSMHQFHEIQNDIVQQVRSLITDVDKGMTTSELHKQATRDLESAVSAWHSSFCSLIKYQRDFLRALHGWFKLTLLPVNTEPTNGTRDVEGVFAFCEEWKHALERIPDTVASEAIKSFINVVHSISLKQAEEVKIKKRTEAASKELERKSSSLRHIERKYYQSYSTVGISLPDAGPDNSHLLDARDPLAEKKAEIATCQRLVEDEMIKHSKAVEVTRAMTLNNIQTGLPGVFQATTSFSMLMTEALEKACTRSYTI